MKTRKNNKGFSLVELIVVVAIMAVLVGILAPAYLKYVEKSRASKDELNAEEIRHAVEIAMVDEEIYQEVVTAAGAAKKLVLVVTEGDTTRDPSTGAISATYIDPFTETLLINEVLDTCGESFDITSKKHTTDKDEYKITIDMTGDKLTVTGVWE